MGNQILGYGVKTLANPSTAINLSAGEAYVIPSGQYAVVPGPFTFFQWYDPVTTTWRSIGTPAQSDSTQISSDGYNYRLFNGTGTVVGAVITNAGTGYTNGIYPPSAQLGTAAAPSVTFAAGGGSILAKGNIIVGGAINTSVTITAGGSNYTRPPVLVVSNPPAGGVPATMTCTISGGAINAVTVTNQGAGYTVAPTVTVVNSSGDTTGSGGVLTVNATLVGSGTVTAITMADNGLGHTSVPAITFSPASTTAATSIMCWTATTVTFAGATNAGNGNFGIIGSTVTAGSATLTNPAISTGIFTPRIGFTAFSTTASPTTTTIVDGGLHQVVPNAVLALNSNGTVAGATTTTIAQGGVTDTSYLIST
jgi:hypothetical protein